MPTPSKKITTRSRSLPAVVAADERFGRIAFEAFEAAGQRRAWGRLNTTNKVRWMIVARAVRSAV